MCLFTVHVYVYELTRHVRARAQRKSFHLERNYIHAVYKVISIFFICEVTALLRQLHQAPQLFHIWDYTTLI